MTKEVILRRQERRRKQRVKNNIMYCIIITVLIALLSSLAVKAYDTECSWRGTHPNGPAYGSQVEFNT